MASSASATAGPIFIDAESLHTTLTHAALINHFHTSLPTITPSNLQTPIRQSYSVSPTSSLLLMPSWSSTPSLPYIGVKLVTYFPQNSPGIHASYVLFSSTTGQTLATLDGTVLTLYRTSSVSGLASKLLSRPDAAVLVMVGAGALAPHLIRAHLAARPGLKEVIIWNRTRKNAVRLAEKLTDELGQNVKIRSCEELDEVVGLGDIVCCATNSESALVKGVKLKRGAHLDLVGSFREEMKECDDEALKRAAVVVVDNEAAMVEAGEIVGGFERGVIEKKDVVLLVDLISGVKVGRKDDDEITVFKSVGSGVVDMLAAQFVYENLGKKKIA
ncbi:Protein SAR DEFICIENT 4 [Linum grandiflorum]